MKNSAGVEEGVINNNIIIIHVFHLYSAHIHYLPEALHKFIPKTTMIL